MTIQSVARFAYFAAALLGAATLATVLLVYPYDDLDESFGKLAGTVSLVAGCLCLGASVSRRPVVLLAPLAIVVGAGGVAWAAGFTALPPPPNIFGDPHNDLRMVAAGLSAGGGLGLLYASLNRTGLRRLINGLFGLIHIWLAIGTGVIFAQVASVAFEINL